MEVRQHPVVKAVLEKFPGAEISDVRDPQPPPPLPGLFDNSESE
jgi:hypothetical protein